MDGGATAGGRAGYRVMTVWRLESQLRKMLSYQEDEMGAAGTDETELERQNAQITELSLIHFCRFLAEKLKLVVFCIQLLRRPAPLHINRLQSVSLDPAVILPLVRRMAIWLQDQTTQGFCL